MLSFLYLALLQGIILRIIGEEKERKLEISKAYYAHP